MKKLLPWYTNPLFFFHILTHISLFFMILHGEWYHWLISIAFYFLFGCWGIAITFHRLVSHRSFNSPKWFKMLGLIFGSLGGVGTSIQWTAVHRDHHRNTDTDADPHNPAGGIKRFFQIQFLTMLVDSSPKYVTDLLRDPVHQRFHKYYWLIHALYALVLLLIDPFAIVYAYLVPSLILWHVMSALGTFAHTPLFGKQPIDQNNKSTNIWFLGYFAFGEGWHNNHHAVASDYKFGKEKWQWDLSAWIIDKIKVV
jgi:stearoyl-CoA desaturase (delta-9 desaturase)